MYDNSLSSFKTFTAYLLLSGFVLLAGCMGSHSQTLSEAAPPFPVIPLQDFMRNAQQVAAKISPDGEKIAWLAPWKQRMNIFVREIDTGKITRVTSHTERGISELSWASDSRIIYTKDTAGEEIFHLFAVDADGSNFLDLTPFDGVNAEEFDRLPDDPEHVLAAMNKRNRQVFDIYKLNIKTGEHLLVAENPGNVSSWLEDNNGDIRGAVAIEGLKKHLLYRKNMSEPFRVLLTVDYRTELEPNFFHKDNKKFYISTNRDRDTVALYLFNPETVEFETVVTEHPDVDIESVAQSRKNKRLLFASYYTDKRHFVFFDEHFRHARQALKKHFDGMGVNIVGMDSNEKMMIVSTYSDRTPGAEYLFNSETNELTLLGESAPWIDPKNLSDVTPITYRARDGLLLHGYLTLPPFGPKQNLPTIMLVHGGPNARDSWGYDPVRQFLANRGMAVLQVNFRGSRGYGKKFLDLGDKQWGQTMQDDLTDGVHWLIEEGIADPSKVAIFGGSYGGYATLAGLTFTPDLYACGIDYVGPANLFTLMKSFPPTWELERQKIFSRVGDPDKDIELFKKISPAFHADQIKKPLFIAQGANDPRVPKNESDQMVAALQKQGATVQYMVKDNEGHGFRNQENRMDFYRAVERFLAKYLGTRHE